MAIILQKTRQLIQAGITAHLHLGAVMCVMRNGEVVLNWAAGEAQEGTPLTADHLICWFSAGKPITAVAIAMLEERKMLTLDDPVAHHLPEFAAHGKDRVTIRHLLTHTAGMRSDVSGYPHANWDESIARICAARLEANWIPGQAAGYHPRTSWFILGEIVRRVTGVAIEQFVQGKIFDPLKMHDTFLAIPDSALDGLQPRLATMHVTRGAALVDANLDTPLHCTRCSPGSSTRGPAGQIARFYQMLLNGGSLDGAKILDRETVDALVSRQRVGLMDQTFKHVLDWGLGIIPNNARYGIETVPYGYGRRASARAFGHGGSQSSVGMADPEHHLVIALAWNGMPGEAAHQQRLRDTLDAIYDDLELT